VAARRLGRTLTCAPWQNDGHVLFGVAVGLIAHYFKREVPGNMAFYGEVCQYGNLAVQAKPTPEMLRRALSAGIDTIMTHWAAKPAAGDTPNGLTVRAIVNLSRVVPAVWGALPPLLP
jgi:hypothetical protein